MARNKKAINTISARAVVNKLKIDSLPSFSFNGEDVIPFGEDNIYPNRIYDAIQKSPTAGGCVKRMNEFIFGKGVINGGFVVNRDHQTFNDIVMRCVDSYVRYKGFALHFNYNPLGQIVEIFNVDFRYPRLLKNLQEAKIANWNRLIGRHYGYTGYVYDDNEIIMNLFDPEQVIPQMKAVKKSDSEDEVFKGQLFYWGADDSIYPTSWIDNSNVSASYEHKVQVYQFANIENGFSGNTIIKYPSIATGEEDIQDEEGNVYKYGTEEWKDAYRRYNPAGRIEQELQNLHGAENSGKSLVVNTPLDASGSTKSFQMVEHLTPTNVDGLFVNQNNKAENDILKTFTMPKILLGISDSGMFNQASFNDAFNYKNADTEGDRKIIERVFNEKIIPHSVYNINVQIDPLKMKGENIIKEEGLKIEESENIIQKELKNV